MAFLPIQERPLDKWILAFVKAVFSPTQFIWKKQPKRPEIFKVSSKRVTAQETPILQADQKRLTEYLETLPAEPKNPLDQEEESFIKKAINMFQLAKPPQPAPVIAPLAQTQPSQKLPIKPSITKVPQPQPKSDRPLGKTTRPKKKPIILPEKPTQPKEPTTEAKFSPTLPFPAPPSQPNTLVGMVLDKDGKIIEGAIIEIRDSQGIPVRALKTNKLGQFRSVTPLDDGQYEIETEKEGYRFDIIKIKLTGAVVTPLEIRAKNKNNEPAQNA